MTRDLIHYGIHFGLPLVLAGLLYPRLWFRATLILLAGILLDLDHLLANPIFDPGRCSIGFHPLHSYPLMVIYVGLLFFRKTRIFGLAACIHMLADLADCWLMARGY